MQDVFIMLLLLPEGAGDDGEPGGDVVGAVHGRGGSVAACIWASLFEQQLVWFFSSFLCCSCSWLAGLCGGFPGLLWDHHQLQVFAGDVHHLPAGHAGGGGYTSCNVLFQSKYILCCSAICFVYLSMGQTSSKTCRYFLYNLQIFVQKNVGPLNEQTNKSVSLEPFGGVCSHLYGSLQSWRRSPANSLWTWIFPASWPIAKHAQSCENTFSEIYLCINLQVLWISSHIKLLPSPINLYLDVNILVQFWTNTISLVIYN